MKTRMTSKDWQILSSYLDGEISSEQKASLERRLASDIELQSNLEEIRRTRAVLRALPQRRVPHNFILIPEMAKPRSVPRLFPVFSFASVMASILFVALLVLQILPNLPVSMAALPQSAMESPVMSVADNGQQPTTPPIILWGPPSQNQPQVEGKGGAGQVEPGIIVSAPTKAEVEKSGFATNSSQETVVVNQPTSVTTDTSTSVPTSGEGQTVVPPQAQTPMLSMAEVVTQTPVSMGRLESTPTPTRTPQVKRIITNPPTSTETPLPALPTAEHNMGVTTQPSIIVSSGQPILGVQYSAGTEVPSQALSEVAAPPAKQGALLGWLTVIGVGLVAVLSGLAAWRMWRSARS